MPRELDFMFEFEGLRSWKVTGLFAKFDFAKIRRRGSFVTFASSGGVRPWAG